MEVANSDGAKVNFLQIKTAIPFPTESVAKVLGAAKKVLLVENNSEGQMGCLIREKTGIMMENRLLKYDGRPFHPAEILDKILSHD